jgi:ParB family chromosome partitioning protein
MAEQDTVPVRIKQMSDAEMIKAQIIENLQRKGVHPLEETQGLRALLNLDEPKCSVRIFTSFLLIISRLAVPLHAS